MRRLLKAALSRLFHGEFRPLQEHRFTPPFLPLPPQDTAVISPFPQSHGFLKKCSEKTFGDCVEMIDNVGMQKKYGPHGFAPDFRENATEGRHHQTYTEQLRIRTWTVCTREGPYRTLTKTVFDLLCPRKFARLCDVVRLLIPPIILFSRYQ